MRRIIPEPLRILPLFFSRADRPERRGIILLFGEFPQSRSDFRAGDTDPCASVQQTGNLTLCNGAAANDNTQSA